MHPPPPWHLTGRVLLIPSGPGGVMLADYTGGTLASRELIRRPVLATGRARIHASPALVRLTGRFVTGTRLGLAGDRLRLTMPAP